MTCFHCGGIRRYRSILVFDLDQKRFQGFSYRELRLLVGLTKSVRRALFRRHSNMVGAGRTVMGLAAAQQLPRAPQSQGL